MGTSQVGDNFEMSSDLPSTVTTPLQWNNRFALLGTNFFTRLQPQALPEPYWVSRNQAVARELGLEQHWFESQTALQAFSGNSELPGPLAKLVAAVNAGKWGRARQHAVTAKRL